MKKVLSFFLAASLIACDSPNEDKAIGKGTITAMADGTYIGKVNLWSSSKSPDKTINAALPDNTDVDILDINGDYFFVRNSLNHKEYGFCNKAFVTEVQFHN
ncbi:hypothetical protein V9K67_26670 [Paraflavisolibacter sp. H34]|uniref:hypothetical protein n=1 Tax=Huijunlia imazamoxiresistens TaxID=3127457 RepID=UPI00301593AE